MFFFVIMLIFVIFAPHTCRADDDTLLSEKSESSGRTADGLKGREPRDSISQKSICTVQIVNRSQSATYDYCVGSLLHEACKVSDTLSMPDG